MDAHKGNEPHAASRARLAAKLQAAAELVAAHGTATLSARLRLTRRAERITHRPASNQLAALLEAAAQLAAAITIQHAYRTAASANVSPSPFSTMSRLEFAMGGLFVQDAFEAEGWFGCTALPLSDPPPTDYTRMYISHIHNCERV